MVHESQKCQGEAAPCHGGNPGHGSRLWTLHTCLYHLAWSTHPSWAHFADGETEAGDSRGACSRWKTPHQNPGPLFRFPHLEGGGHSCKVLAPTVSSSTLVILNTPSSHLIPRPPGEAGILIPTSRMTKVRLRGQSSQDLDPGLPASKSMLLVGACSTNYFLVIKGKYSLKIQMSRIAKIDAMKT